MAEIVAVVSKGAGWKPEREWLEKLLRPARRQGSGPAASAVAGPAGGAAQDPLGGPAERCVFQEGRLLVVCDAEIYNRAELFPADPGASEAEIIAKLYRASGADWWRGVIGEYAAFIWDGEQGRGLAFTDPVGIRPLAWREDAEKVVIASRIASLAAVPGASRELQPQAVFSYLYMHQVPTPHAIFKGIRKLESGHMLAADKAGARESMAWNMRYPAEKVRDQGELERRLYDLMKGAVGRQAAYGSGVAKTGSFLSGGTDSSLIAGLFQELFPGQAKTFTIGFREPGYDEMEYARIASKAFRTAAHEYYVTADDVVDALPAIARAFDEPFANSSVIPTYYCAVEARKAGLDTLLGGDGGDELFGGNSRYLEYFQDFDRFPRWMEAAGRVATALAPGFAKSRGPLKKMVNYLKRKDAPLHERINAFDLSYYLEDAREIFSAAVLDAGALERPADIAKRYLDRADTADALDRFLYHDLKITLMDNDLRKVNRMSELAGIKVRFPFLARDVVEYSGLIPTDLKVRDGKLRYLYKEAFRHILPGEIITKTKHGFGLPVVQWMMRPGRFNDLLRDTLFDGRLERRAIFAKGFVDRLHRLSRDDNSPYFGTYLYSVFFLELWLREHMDAPAA